MNPTPAVPLAESIGAIAELKNEGKIRHVGLSNVSESQLREAQRIVPIVSVQNRYNASDRRSESLIDLCEQEQLVFLPWAPVQESGKNPAWKKMYEPWKKFREQEFLWHRAAEFSYEQFVYNNPLGGK